MMRQDHVEGYGAPGAEAATAQQQHVLVRDYETRSVIDLREAGAFKYSLHASTSVLCCAFAIDDGPVQLCIPGQQPTPPEFIEAARNPNWTVVAHNDPFETCMEQNLLHPRFGWPLVPIERHRCTMAEASALSLPAKLERVAEALFLVNTKDPAGQKLMLQMCKPRRPRKGEDPNGIYWFEDPERLQRLYEYCRQDVEVERELYQELRRLAPTEQHYWVLDFRINSRGIAADLDTAHAARKIISEAKPALDAEMCTVTNGAVPKTSQTAKIRAFLGEHGCQTKTIAKEPLGKLLAQELPPVVRRVLELRQEAAFASVAKIDALLERCCDDGRLRGLLQFHGASTGRWSGRSVQPQNLPSPPTGFDVEAAIEDIRTCSYEHLRSKYPNPISAISYCIRGMFCAAPGHRLIDADFSGIEARTLAWLVGEGWKLDAFKTGTDIYLVTAAKIFGVPVESLNKDSPERKIGKTCELAFGYAGGVGAWRKFEPDSKLSDGEIDQIKNDWRKAHPKVVRFWYDVTDAALKAVRNPGKVVLCGRVAFKVEGIFLFLKLPNGRKLAYPYPVIRTTERNGRDQDIVVFKDNSAGRWCDCRNGEGAYSGVWTENIVQAISRDLMAEAIVRIEHAGYPVVLHVHDEICAEAAEGFGSLEEFQQILTVVPSWAEGLPIASEGWIGQRFRK